MDVKNIATEKMRRSWNVDLINAHGGRWLALQNLPDEAVGALIVYAHGATVQWNELDPELIIETHDELQRLYRGLKFGLAFIPMAEAKRYVIEFGLNSPDDDECDLFGDFESFYKWYVGERKNKRLVIHKKQWLVILSSFHDEFIQDGWHRLVSYVTQKRRRVPVLLYPDGVK